MILNKSHIQIELATPGDSETILWYSRLLKTQHGLEYCGRVIIREIDKESHINFKVPL